MDRGSAAERVGGLLCAACLSWAVKMAAASGATPMTAPAGEMEARAAEIISQLPPLALHFTDLAEADAARQRTAATNYAALVQEKLAGRWFAAFVGRAFPEGGARGAKGDGLAAGNEESEAPFAIAARFQSWSELTNFLREQAALVEVWARGEAGKEPARRLAAGELAAMKRRRQVQPTMVTVTYRDRPSGRVRSYELEFGFEAANLALDAERAYREGRELQVAGEALLSARDSQGELNSVAQWEALRQSAASGKLVIAEMPARPTRTNDLFVAFEYEVDAQGNPRRIARIYHESEVHPTVVDGVQQLVLRRAEERQERRVLGFERRGFQGELIPAPHPILGEDVIELRVQSPDQPDPRTWNVLMFGEPEVLKQSVLARFALLNAYLDRQRKLRARQQAELGLIVEPVIAAIQIGGGLAGIGFPAGDAARILYNLVAAGMIQEVPNARQMRELFALMAARDRQPGLKAKPERYLRPEDIEQLKASGRRLSDAEVQAYLARMNDEDVQAMLRLARMGLVDQRVSNFMNLLTSVLKTSGVSDRAGIWRDLFNNVRFAMNGELNLKTLAAIAAGQRGLTPLSGTSLQALSHGQGPAQAWVQFLEVSVDLRAVANTVWRLTKRSRAKKELEKPFPYSPRLSDLAAYEVRAFGFPFLMFYKRGLIEADLKAYEQDYAYGILGVRVVEHFRTRQEMDAEIRAGRMAPLGFVRVPNGRGGWKETDLAVFAHQVPAGRYRGKTTLIIYGLQAYREHSEYIERELDRFRQYQRALEEGGVIEQVVAVESGASLPPSAFEPVIEAGPTRLAESFDPLLGNLVELRRLALRRAWGLPESAADAVELERVRERLKSRRVEVDESKPLLDVDSFNSSFIYRRRVQGAWAEVKVTAIPSLADLDRGLAEAEEAKQIEAIRRAAAAGERQGIVLLNEVKETDGRLEVGPLVRDDAGRVAIEGLSSGAKTIDQILDLLQQLPVTERARLQYNHFAGTVVTLSPYEGAAPRRAFLTLDFPSGPVMREWTNPLSGEREVLHYAQGVCRQVVTDQRIVELNYDATGYETNTRTCVNLGTRQAPKPGPCLEETRTLAIWPRDLGRADTDPYAPLIAKLRIDKVTGRVSRETYGLFPLPIETTDGVQVVQNRFNDWGVFLSGSVWEPGGEATNATAILVAGHLPLEAGRERFRLAAALPDAASRRDWSAAGYQVAITKRDVLEGVAKTEVYDGTHQGRKLGEWYEDPLDSARNFTVAITNEFRADFCYGLVPVRTVVSSARSGRLLTEVSTLSYSARDQRLVAVARDWAGRVVTNTWVWPWADPVVADTTRLHTVTAYKEGELGTTAKVTSAISGAVLSEAGSRYDPAARVWVVTRTNYYRPGLVSGVENAVYSPFGRLMRVQAAAAIETRPVYDDDGQEIGQRTFYRDAATGRFDRLAIEEDDYHWDRGARNARVRVYVEGTFHDEYRAVTDAEGRKILDGLRRFPGLELETEIDWEREGDRWSRAYTYQNGELRAEQVVLPEQRQTDGSFWVPVEVIPAWGLRVTNYYRLGDPTGRVIMTVAENGEITRPTDWFAGSASARITEVTDRHGRVRERAVARLNRGLEDRLPFDELVRYQVGPAGATGWAQTTAMVRGTDVPLFTDTATARVFYDLGRPFQAPRYAVDPMQVQGVPVEVAGRRRDHVTAVFEAQPASIAGAGGSGAKPEPVLEIESVDLQGLFYHVVSHRTLDRAGRVLAETQGKIGTLGSLDYTADNLLASAARQRPTKSFTYHYRPGWMARLADAETEQAGFAFTSESPTPGLPSWAVNQDGWRDWPTEVEGRETASEDAAEHNARLRLPFRRLSRSRLLERNPYLPTITNSWTVWTSATLDGYGQTLFEAEVFYDASGQACTTVARKVNAAGQNGDRISYRLPNPFREPVSAASLLPVKGEARAGAGEPSGLQATGPLESWPGASLLAGTNTFNLPFSTLPDLSRCDFVAFFLEAPTAATVSVEAADSAGHVATVSDTEVARAGAHVAFWPAGSSEAYWLPDQVLPVHGAAIDAAGPLTPDQRLVAVPVAELERVGLEIQRLSAVRLRLVSPTAARARWTPLVGLVHRRTHLPASRVRPSSYQLVRHESGLETLVRYADTRTQHEMRTDRGWQAWVGLGGMPVVLLSPREQPPYFPVAVLIDDADAGSPRPLYALAAEDGRLQEYYQTLRIGDAQVYTVVHGFDTPKLEVFRAGVLDDEVAPGVLAFGHGYYVTLPMLKAGGRVGSAIANLRNRCIASAFTLGGERFLRAIRGDEPGGREFSQFSSELGPAYRQAAQLTQLPTLAEALLPRRPLPWPADTAPATVAAPVAGMPRTLALHLHQLSTNYSTHLIPTAPGTPAERFVDTVEEAALIQLAVQLGEGSLANELLAFYWDRSQGGVNLLATSYDAKTGASLVKTPRYLRPSDAEHTAEAQIAVAEAAYCVGLATGNQPAVDFGARLLSLTLREFRPPLSTSTWPRGISDLHPQPEKRAYGLMLWPEAQSFSLRCNARAYLLLKRLADLADRYPWGADWKRALHEATAEQAAWLTQHILPYQRRTGVAPRGWFQIQDVQGRTSAYAPERWTAADDWLVFLEAADQIGVSRTETRAWLANLARVHGVHVDGIWGLDWSVALRRLDAISPTLTARFARVAELLGDERAAAFARSNLARLRQGDHWPAVFTRATNDVLQTGQGFAIYSKAAGSLGRPASPSAGAGNAMGGSPTSWPESLAVYATLAGATWPTNVKAGTAFQPRPVAPGDIRWFLWTAALFYLSILGTSLFWWRLSALRRARAAQAPSSSSGSLVPDSIMQLAEERWAKRVLGAMAPPKAERSRLSNAAIEQNFHMQLRAIYKLGIEWRRLMNGWSEDDRRVVEDGSDEWLNGLDELAVIVGIYSRWVVKAGKKDGRPQANVLAENEDSNHIWSRLVMYFSESHWGLIDLIKQYKAEPEAAEIFGVNSQIELVLRTLGVRQRAEPFDGRVAFNAPGNPQALDLLKLQLPGATLERLTEEMERQLNIPQAHTIDFIKGYKAFKQREQLLPTHPYLIEAARILPHFLLMGLVSLIWYNLSLGGLKIYPYLEEVAIGLALDWSSLVWAAPTFAGLAFTITALAVRIYRYRWRMRSIAEPQLVLDVSVTAMFTKGQAATPTLRGSLGWEPAVYERVGWLLRAVGFSALGVTLMRLEPPSFATFMFVKGFVAVLLFLEAAAVAVPLAVNRVCMWLEDYTATHPQAPRLVKFLNQLNLVPTQPASLLGLSLKYHFQPSVPTGGAVAMIQAIVFYLVFSSTFFFVGGYLYKQALEVWFQETYRNGWEDFALLLGSLLFWNTMYLLRFGLFVLFAAAGAALATYPLRLLGGLGCGLYLGLQLFDNPVGAWFRSQPTLTCSGLLLGLVLMAFESEVLAAIRRWGPFAWAARRRQERQRQALTEIVRDRSRTLGVVYMSGDDLSFHKLNADLLMGRLQTLRDQLQSGGLELLEAMQSWPDDATLGRWFQELYAVEKRADVTLWHPMQLELPGETSALNASPGLTLGVETEEQRQRLLTTWHLRRWLVTMMSTAGHAQDTGINLVDIALRLNEENLGGNVAFYLIQNKYDNLDNNRPVQLAYDAGELGQRDKLARLLMAVAPGARAYNLNDWTPFGFKAGGLVGMDLVYEESLRLSNMLVLDRNANAHDLEAVVSDLKLALSDPGIVIVIPGRSTTNTLTPLGQGSQALEEGHRALTRGVMMLGGRAGESIGTGWGNIQAVYYGRVQRALCDPAMPLMPLTFRQRRGTSLRERCEGLIGFGPHAVGISEDIWGVTQTAHNAIALGTPVRFVQSRTFWHKIRESWSHAEWFSAFPRWSGGYLQMMLDPIMQRINDHGPLSVFAKEIRANGGRFFLSAPFALLSILFMPLAILWDFSPFVQILILLWNFGFVMNQVLTTLGLVACLEGAGFNRGTAVVGTALAGSLATAVPAASPFAPALMGLGLLIGGFALGLGRWLYYRGRDVILFGPQLVIHALGQVLRQSLEFVLSGASANDAKAVNIPFRAWAGPREDRPFETYQNLINLPTVVWGVGLVSLALNLFALSRLDFLNVLLLLPSLLFSVSLLIGPFLMAPKPAGRPGLWLWLPKLAGWLSAFGFYAWVAWLIARGGLAAWLGLGLLAVCFGGLGRIGLRYFGYPSKLGRLTRSLERQLAAAGLEASASRSLAQTMVRGLGCDPEKARSALGRTTLTPAAQAAALQFVTGELFPWLKRPLTDAGRGRWANSRFYCEFARSFVLAVFTLIWFFIVPVPGLLVFTAPAGYRLSLSLTSVLVGSGAVIGGALIGLGVSLVLESWLKRGGQGRGLMRRVEACHRAFRALLLERGRLTPVQVSSLSALFTDVQTYYDQRSYAYAARALEQIDRCLRSAGQGGTGAAASGLPNGVS